MIEIKKVDKEEGKITLYWLINKLYNILWFNFFIIFFYFSIIELNINIFTQIGFVVLVGLACKNAILIVEYARARNQAGVSVYEATLDACRLRLRPIIMTSFAFIFGVIPLVLGEGAGAEMRRTLGTAVFSGMLGVTLFGILLTPVFFYVIQRIANWRQTASADNPTSGS